MSYIRLTLASPPPDRRAVVHQCSTDIVASAATLPGFVLGWVVVPSQGVDDVGRLTVWQTAAAAHHAANGPHLLALHAQAHVAAAGKVWDRSFGTAIDGDGAARTAAPELDPAAAVRAVDALLHPRTGGPSDD